MLQRIFLTALLFIGFSQAQAGPEIQHWQTENGMKVYFVPATELPMVDIRITFDAGGARDNGQAGLARLTNYMLNQGADGMNADQIAEAFEQIGAQYGAGALRDMSWLSLRSLSEPKYLQPALNTFASVLWSPEFPQQDLERLKNQMLVAIKAEEADPGEIATKAFYKALYADHPYASPMKGTLESIPALKREDLQAFHQRYFVANNGLIALTGDLTKAQAETIAEGLSQGLKAGEAAPVIPAVKPLEKAQEIRIPYPSRQAHVMMGQPGIHRGHPDYFGLYLGNHVFGGSGFTSRLVKEVRVKRGYVYSIYSYFALMRAQGPYLIGLQTRGSQVEDAIKIINENLDLFAEKGPTDEEITASKQNITGGFPLRIASNSDIVEYLAVIGFYGLPLDYLDTFTGRIEAIEQQDIIDVWRRNVDPGKMVTVIVGGNEE